MNLMPQIQNIIIRSGRTVGGLGLVCQVIMCCVKGRSVRPFGLGFQAHVDTSPLYNQPTVPVYYSNLEIRLQTCCMAAFSFSLSAKCILYGLYQRRREEGQREINNSGLLPAPVFHWLFFLSNPNLKSPQVYQLILDNSFVLNAPKMLFFFEPHSTDADAYKHARTFTSMNTRATLPL